MAHGDGRSDVVVDELNHDWGENVLHKCGLFVSAGLDFDVWVDLVKNMGQDHVKIELDVLDSRGQCRVWRWSHVCVAATHRVARWHAWHVRAAAVVARLRERQRLVTVELWLRNSNCLGHGQHGATEKGCLEHSWLVGLVVCFGHRSDDADLFDFDY